MGNGWPREALMELSRCGMLQMVRWRRRTKDIAGVSGRLPGHRMGSRLLLAATIWHVSGTPRRVRPYSRMVDIRALSYQLPGHQMGSGSRRAVMIKRCTCGRLATGKTYSSIQNIMTMSILLPGHQTASILPLPVLMILLMYGSPSKLAFVTH